MQHTESFFVNARASAPRTSEIVRSRTAQAFVLTSIAVGIGAALVVVFGPMAIPFYLVGLPVPLVLLWRSADVMRTDERRSS